MAAAAWQVLGRRREDMEGGWREEDREDVGGGRVRKEGLDSRRMESKKCRFVMIGGRGNDAVGFRRRMTKGWTSMYHMLEGRME